MTGYIPIAELAAMLHARDNPWKSMVLAKAYFDESGLHANSPVIAVGGLMGTEKTWSALEADWLAELNRLAPDIVIPPFHATDCELGRDEFSQVLDVVRQNLPGRLAAIIRKHKPMCVWSSFTLEDWNEVTDNAFRQAYPHPFLLCFELCAQELARWQREVASDSPIALVYSEQREFAPKLGIIWDAYNRAKRLAPFNSFTTTSYKTCVPLQAADLAAYECYRHWLDFEYGDRPFRPRPGAKALLTSATDIEMIGHHSQATLKDVVRQFHDGHWPYSLP